MSLDRVNTYLPNYYLDQQFGDAAIDIDIRGVSTDYWEGGLLFRSAGVGTGYAFQIYSQGGYFFRTWLDDPNSFTYIIRPTLSEYIKKGTATNHLRVISKGSQITMLVNGHCLAVVRDNSYSAGRIGLIVATLKNFTNVHMAFDNLVVWSLE